MLVNLTSTTPWNLEALTSWFKQSTPEPDAPPEHAESEPLLPSLDRLPWPDMSLLQTEILYTARGGSSLAVACGIAKVWVRTFDMRAFLVTSGVCAGWGALSAAVGIAYAHQKGEDLLNKKVAPNESPPQAHTGSMPPGATER